jgi:hypothetical protein
MERMAQPQPETPIVPITHHLFVQGDDIKGSAIAMQWDGTQMLYLVVRQDAKSVPVWVVESQITQANI